MNPISLAWCALGAAVMADRYLLPEQAFYFVETCGKKRLPKIMPDDIPDILALKSEGMSWKDIAYVYGVNPAAVFRRVEKARKR